MKSIVSFDLDMTLLNPRTHHIPESAMEAISRLRKSCYIVIATGIFGMEKLAERLISITCLLCPCVF